MRGDDNLQEGMEPRVTRTPILQQTARGLVIKKPFCQKFAKSSGRSQIVILAVPMRDPHEASKVDYGNLANSFDPRCPL
jgi:hypothetical protein